MSVYTFDERCFDLARHFLPDASESAVNALAQEIQDTVEMFDAGDNDQRNHQWEDDHDYPF